MPQYIKELTSMVMVLKNFVDQIMPLEPSIDQIHINMAYHQLVADAIT